MVPRTEERFPARKYSHYHIHDKPCRKNEYESDADIPENFLGFACLSGLSSRSDVLPACVCEENGGKKYCEVDTSVQDILRKLGDVAKCAIGPVAGNYCRYLRERYRRRDEEKDE